MFEFTEELMIFDSRLMLEFNENLDRRSPT
jgi:hypothetical protein